MNAQIRHTPITSFKVGISLKRKQILKEDKTEITAIYPMTIFGHLFGENHAIELKEMTDAPPVYLTSERRVCARCSLQLLKFTCIVQDVQIWSLDI